MALKAIIGGGINGRINCGIRPVFASSGGGASSGLLEWQSSPFFWQGSNLGWQITVGLPTYAALASDGSAAIASDGSYVVTSS